MLGGCVSRRREEKEAAKERQETWDLTGLTELPSRRKKIG
jgi:hypothetical protein